MIWPFTKAEDPRAADLKAAADESTKAYQKLMAAMDGGSKAMEDLANVPLTRRAPGDAN